jgi:hypothetical protein
VDIFQCITYKNSAHTVYPIIATLTVPWSPKFHFCKFLGLPDPWTWKRHFLSNRRELIIMLKPGSWTSKLWKPQISHNTVIYVQITAVLFLVRSKHFPGQFQAKDYILPRIWAIRGFISCWFSHHPLAQRQFDLSDIMRLYLTIWLIVPQETYEQHTKDIFNKPNFTKI